MRGGMGALRVATGIASAAFAVWVSGCRTDAPPACVPAAVYDVTPSALAATPDAKLVAAPEGFGLVAAAGETVRWGTLSSVGALGAEGEVALPPARTAGPWLGYAASRPVVVVARPAPETAGALSLELVPATPGATPLRLDTLPVGADPAALRVAIETAADGATAMVAFGFEGSSLPLTTVVLGADGTPAGPPVTIPEAPAAWRCLRFTSGPAPFQLSLIGASDATNKTLMTVLELRDNHLAFRHEITLNVKDPGCPVVSSTPRGYVMAWQTRDGTFFANYHVLPGTGGDVNQEFLAGAVRFGGPDRQPPLVAIAPRTGDPNRDEFALLFGGPTTPQVWLFDGYGHLIGGPLLLPSPGRVGPVTAVATPEGLWTSYADDQPSAPMDASASGPRHLLRISCPLASP